MLARQDHVGPAMASPRSGASVAAQPRFGGAFPQASDVALALLYGLFALAHIRLARETGRWLELLPLVVQETLLVVLFISRRPASRTSRRVSDWVVAVLGTFLPLLLLAHDRPAALAPLGTLLQGLGLAVALAALATLGRSIGVVAADRGIKTGGPYRVVRHPAYAGYLLTYTGFVLSYPSLWNTLVTLATAICLVGRVFAEERHLAATLAYRAYQRRVRWRLLPGVC